MAVPKNLNRKTCTFTPLLQFTEYHTTSGTIKFSYIVQDLHSLYHFILIDANITSISCTLTHQYPCHALKLHQRLQRINGGSAAWPKQKVGNVKPWWRCVFFFLSIKGSRVNSGGERIKLQGWRKDKREGIIGEENGMKQREVGRKWDDSRVGV